MIRTCRWAISYNDVKKKTKKIKYSKTHFVLAFVLAMGGMAGIRHAFSIEVPLNVAQDSAAQDLMAVAQPEHQTVLENASIEAETISDLNEDESALYDADNDTATGDISASVADEVENANEASSTDVHSALDLAYKNRRIRGVWSYADCFPDIQDIQIVAAQKHGITPVKNREEADRLVKRHKLVNICHSPFYVVDSLTHSIPYLVPRAQHLLNTICLNFIDSCQVKGLPPHLLMVTSVLRTTDDVSNLQRGNKNATTNSCHCYGTTVDIAYNRFLPVTGDYYNNPALLRWNEPMKQVLAEVLNDLRTQNKCYVKYERKQGCFHLTCR